MTSPLPDADMMCTPSKSMQAGFDVIVTRLLEAFNADYFMPHGHCYLWRPEILWLHVLSDAVIALAYFSIPVALYVFAVKRKDLQFRWVFFLFTAFIMLCGLTHILNIVIVWVPIYGPEGLLKLATAAVSAVTAFALWPLIPTLLSLPNPEHYRRQNEQLQSEIRHREAAELNQRLLSERLSLATDIGQIGVWELDGPTGTLVWDETMFSVYGVDPDGFTERYEDWQRQVLPDDLEDVEAKVEKVFAEGGSFQAQFRIRHPDGTIRYIKASGRRVGEQGAARLIGVNYDVTKDVTIKERLQRKTEEAEHASQLKSAFLANMSHEIRTPLNGILGGCQVLERKNEDPSLSEWIEMIASSGRSLMTIINDVLDISKIETGFLKIAVEETPAKDVTTQALNSVRSLADEKGLTLTVETGATDDLAIHTDRARLCQVLVNLLGNAIKFTDSGGVTLRSEVLSGETPRIRLAVEDTGPGIPEDKQSLIFERFRQIDGSNTRRHGGTGLGLAISKDLIELMGGSIRVDSRVGHGSKFTITLPVNPPLDDTTADAPDETDTDDPGPGDGPDADPANAAKRILIAEDNDMNQRLLAEFLASAEYSLHLVDNGQEALEAIAARHYDLVIMDIQMPVMNGDEAIRRIRASRTTYAAVPIIVLTANAMSGAREEYLRLGADDYLSKPVEQDDLLDRVRSLLTARARAAR